MSYSARWSKLTCASASDMASFYFWTTLGHATLVKYSYCVVLGLNKHSWYLCTFYNTLHLFPSQMAPFRCSAHDRSLRYFCSILNCSKYKYFPSFYNCLSSLSFPKVHIFPQVFNTTFQILTIPKPKHFWSFCSSLSSLIYSTDEIFPIFLTVSYPVLVIAKLKYFPGRYISQFSTAIFQVFLIFFCLFSGNNPVSFRTTFSKLHDNLL